MSLVLANVFTPTYARSFVIISIKTLDYWSRLTQTRSYAKSLLRVMCFSENAELERLLAAKK